MKAAAARDPAGSEHSETAVAIEPASGPFRGLGLLARTAPFAVVAALAEASLALSPGWSSTAAAVVSLALLLLVPAAFTLPWARLPSWTPVLVPLVYTGSVLALLLAAGPTSGAGIVILIPLVWAALFHRRWESACIVAAIVVVEVIVSLVPVAVADAVLVRRVVLWGSLGALISIATHRLRDRIRRSQEERARLEHRLRQEVVRLCGEHVPAGEPAPECSFRGPVDSVLDGEAGRQLLAILRNALAVIGQQGRRPTLVGVAVGDDVCLTIVGARAPRPDPAMNGYDHDLDRLSTGGRRLGATLRVEDVPGGTRHSWQFPAGATRLV